jgi:hypothetical protein
VQAQNPAILLCLVKLWIVLMHSATAHPSEEADLALYAKVHYSTYLVTPILLYCCVLCAVCCVLYAVYVCLWIVLMHSATAHPSEEADLALYAKVGILYVIYCVSVCLWIVLMHSATAHPSEEADLALYAKVHCSTAILSLLYCCTAILLCTVYCVLCAVCFMSVCLCVCVCVCVCCVSVSVCVCMCAVSVCLWIVLMHSASAHPSEEADLALYAKVGNICVICYTHTPIHMCYLLLS